jgi:endonuclease/exonuclease/phosphatase (EEP) superfamily protein YafD
VAALVWRRWFLGALAVAVAVAQLVFVLPELTAAEPLPAGALGAPSLRLFDANVLDRNTEMPAYAAQIRQFRPDLVTLEEASPLDAQELGALGAFRGLPYQVRVALVGPAAFVVASRYPLRGRVVDRVDRSPYLVRTEIVLPSGPLAVWVVHTSAPVDPDWQRWSVELAGVDAALRAARPRPLLMVGDFNATWGNRGFRAIVDDGLTDAAAARGRALDMTWPQHRVVPPFVRIDHVLTAGALAVTTIATHTGPGSDHRDLTATVAVLPRRVSAGSGSGRR